MADPNTEIALANPLLQRYNEINKSITLLVPAVAVAQDTLEKVLPLMEEMQKLLSRRPKGQPSGEFRMLRRKGKRIVGSELIEDVNALPTWSVWLASFALEVGYSVRHLQRWIHHEPKHRTHKECGWSKWAHERALEIMMKSRELVRAHATGEGGEIYRICGELERLLDASQELVDEDWQTDVRVGRKHASRKVTRVEPAA
jgi:hypothetical protein